MRLVRLPYLSAKNARKIVMRHGSWVYRSRSGNSGRSGTDTELGFVAFSGLVKVGQKNSDLAQTVYNRRITAPDKVTGYYRHRG